MRQQNVARAFDKSSRQKCWTLRIAIIIWVVLQGETPPASSAPRIYAHSRLACTTRYHPFAVAGDHRPGEWANWFSLNSLNLIWCVRCASSSVLGWLVWLFGWELVDGQSLSCVHAAVARAIALNWCAVSAGARCRDAAAWPGKVWLRAPAHDNTHGVDISGSIWL